MEARLAESTSASYRSNEIRFKDGCNCKMYMLLSIPNATRRVTGRTAVTKRCLPVMGPYIFSSLRRRHSVVSAAGNYDGPVTDKINGKASYVFNKDRFVPAGLRCVFLQPRVSGTCCR